MSTTTTAMIRSRAAATRRRRGPDGAFIHFALYQSKDGSTTIGAQVAFRVDDLDDAHVRAVGAGVGVVHEPKPQPWGRSARYRDLDIEAQRARIAV